MQRTVLMAVAVCLVGGAGTVSALGQWRYLDAGPAPARQVDPAVESSAPPAAALPVPGNNMTMAAVSTRFGDPENEAPAVGKPPIRRWYYPGYTVYFEHDRVIISVLD